jgi:hypothetical protein
MNSRTKQYSIIAGELYKSGLVAPWKLNIWFWIINDNLGLTFVLSGWIRQGGPIQVMELDDASWWMEMVQKIDQVLMLGKEEREK